MYTKLIPICIFLICSQVRSQGPKVFPVDFKWGVSTSAYQIEGAWNQDGKGVSVWDTITHSSASFVQDKSSGDVACDSYNKYKEDVQLIKSLGVKNYRFSLAWTRIFPRGFSYEKNQAGIDYYNNLINELKINEIEPAVTLYHWDTPASYSPLGSWTNEVMVEEFANFARFAFETFGDRVKMWFTFNEPKVFCLDYNYVTGNASITHPVGEIEYLCVHTVIKAHAEAYRIYDSEFRAKQGGGVSIVLNFEWSEPSTAEDEEAAEQRRQFEFGWFANPIILGDYPEVMKNRIGNRSEQEGFSQSRLPKFTEKEIGDIKGTYDFIAINHYTTWYVRAGPEEPIDKIRPTYYADMGTIRHQDPAWGGSGAEHMKVVPWGLRKLLLWIHETYDKEKDIYITECGYPDFGGLEDDERINFYHEYITEVHNAIGQGATNVNGFFAWTLLDNFEWGFGYTLKYGLFDVNFNDPQRPRTAKKSAAYYGNIASTNTVLE